MPRWGDNQKRGQGKRKAVGVFVTNWAKALEDAVAEQADKVPSGWKTLAQVAEEMHLKKARTGEIMTLLIKTSKAERREFKVKSGNALRPVPHYRLK